MGSVDVLYRPFDTELDSCLLVGSAYVPEFTLVGLFLNQPVVITVSCIGRIDDIIVHKTVVFVWLVSRPVEGNALSSAYEMYPPAICAYIQRCSG